MRTRTRAGSSFTDRIIEVVSEQQPHLVFMLWGAHAQSKQKLIDATKHLVLKSVHPSPLSAYRGFLGCGHFSRTNKFPEQNGETPIEWRCRRFENLAGQGFCAGLPSGIPVSPLNNGSARNSTNSSRITCIAVTSGTDSCRVSAVRLISAIPPGIIPRSANADPDGSARSSPCRRRGNQHGQCRAIRCAHERRRAAEERRLK
jgi:hypothetical protein